MNKLPSHVLADAQAFAQLLFTVCTHLALAVFTAMLIGPYSPTFAALPIGGMVITQVTLIRFTFEDWEKTVKEINC